MDIHKNARLTPLGREHLVRMVLSGQTLQAAGEAGGVCPRTGRKWLDRHNQEGLADLQDRSFIGCASRQSSVSKSCATSACRARRSPPTVAKYMAKGGRARSQPGRLSCATKQPASMPWTSWSCRRPASSCS